MIIILKHIYHFFLRSINSIYSKILKWIYFLQPNFIKLILGRVVIDKYTKFYQITFCKGAGQVEIGKNCIFGTKLGGFHRGGSIELQARYEKAKIKIGNNVATNNNILFCAANYIEIGEDTLIGQNVTIMDFEAHGIEPLKRRQIGEIGKILIGKNVWIGNNVTILKNSSIGNNTIVATGAVVSGVFPANVIIGGVPAKIIKSL